MFLITGNILQKKLRAKMNITYKKKWIVSRRIVCSLILEEEKKMEVDPIKITELKFTVRDMKNRKVPGLDVINSVI